MSIIPVNVNQIIHNASPYYLGLALNSGTLAMPTTPTVSEVGVTTVKTQNAKIKSVTLVTAADLGANTVTIQVIALLPDGGTVNLTDPTLFDTNNAGAPGEVEFKVINDTTNLPAGTSITADISAVTGASHPSMSLTVQAA